MQTATGRLALTLTLFLIGLVMPITVYGWVTQPPIWDLGNTPYVRYASYRLPSGMQNRLNDARLSWNMAGSKLRYYRDDKNAPIMVDDQFIDGRGGVLGVAIRYFAWDPYISRATLLVDTTELWYMGTGIPPAGQFDLWSVFAHELGHIAGIMHTNRLCRINSGPTMCPSLGSGQIYMRSLHWDDLQALRSLYP